MQLDSEDEEPGGAAENLPKVGYRNPPIASRFKKGVSGNPAGRPPNGYPMVNPLPLVIEAPIVTGAKRLITVIENGERITMPTGDAFARSILASAANGNQRALLYVMRKIDEHDKRTSDNAIKFLGVMVQYKRTHIDECNRAKKKCLHWTPPIPHPEDIVIKMETAEVIFNGLKDESEAATWIKMFQARDIAFKIIEDMTQKRERVGDDPAELRDIDLTIRREQELIDFVGSGLPDETTRRVSGFNLIMWRMRNPRYQKNVKFVKRNEQKALRRLQKLEICPKPFGAP